MPDTWEYPWFAAWDLAFHCVALALTDVDFAKQQIEFLLQENYLHPNGQIPAYEWAFGDVNPPVHAWGALKVYRGERVQRGCGDKRFLKRVFNRLLLNYALVQALEKFHRFLGDERPITRAGQVCYPIW